MYKRIIEGFVVFFLLLGIFAFWGMPWASQEATSKITDFLAFLITILGFGATIYQLNETEIAIRESQEKPELKLQFVSSNNNVEGSYGSEPIIDIRLRKSDNEKKLKAKVGLRVTNSGTRSASKINLFFIVRRKGVIDKTKVDIDKENSEGKPDLSIGELDITLSERQSFGSQYIEYTDYFSRVGFRGKQRRFAGITLNFNQQLVIHNDHYDRPVLAELDIAFDSNDFESEFEVWYRIHSYEGNSVIDKMNSRLKNRYQYYPVRFLIDD